MGSRFSIPKQFSASIGGFMGPTFSVELKGNILFYSGNLYGHSRQLTITPTKEDWQYFWQAAEEIGIWGWQDNYSNPDDLDGTNWSLEIHMDDRKKKCSGRNSYPMKDGRPSNNPVVTATFRKFLSSVRRLIGGLDFA